MANAGVIVKGQVGILGTVAGYVYTAGNFILFTCIGGALVFLLVLLIGTLDKSTRGLYLVLRDRMTLVEKHPRSKFRTRFGLFLCKLPFVILEAVLKYFIRPALKNIGYIFLFFIFIFVMGYFGERHLDESISWVTDVTDLSIDAVNLGGLFLQLSLEIGNMVVDIPNVGVRLGVFTGIELYEGMQYHLEHFTRNGRRLEEDMGFSSGFIDALQAMLDIYVLFMDAQLEFITAIFRFVFYTGMLSVLNGLVTAMIVIVTKLGCIMASFLCGLREVADFIVNDFIPGIFNVFAFFFGGEFPRLEGISCATEELTSSGITHVCYGSLLSIDPPGPFRNAPTSANNGRRLVSCVEVGGLYEESVDDMHLHSTANQSQACPYTKAAFHPYGHALNMAALDTHECYKLCVRDILVLACDDKKTHLGVCGQAHKNVTTAYARRRLDSFFDAKTWLEPHVESTTPHGPAHKHTRSEMIHLISERIGALVFSTEAIECDLRLGTSSFMETLVDGICVMSKLHSSIPPRRGLEDTDSARTGRSIVDWASQQRHKGRALSTYTSGYIHPSAAKYEGAMHALQHRLKTWSPVPLDVKHPGRLHRRGLAMVCVGQKLCPDGIQCVDEYSECDTVEHLGPIGATRYYIEVGDQWLKRNSDLRTFMYMGYLCWKEYKIRPEEDPYDVGNNGLSVAQRRIQCHWCLPMIPPTQWKFKPFEFSVKKAVEDYCVVVADDFSACRCPMFYNPPRSTVDYFEFFSLNFAMTLGNGLIWFKNWLVFLTGNWIGYFWSGLFPETVFPMEINRAFLLYSEHIPFQAYLACQVFRTWSAMVLIATIALMISLGLVFYTVGFFVLNFIRIEVGIKKNV